MKYLILFIFALFGIQNTSAQVGGDIMRPEGTLNLDGGPSELIVQVISYGIGIAAILGVMGITWGGIQMIIATGEDEKMKKARYMILYSIIGVIIAGMAYGIVRLIGGLEI